MKQTNEHIAKVAGKDLPISTKQSIEIANFIRNKNLQKVKRLLEEVIAMKRAIPFKRFNIDMGHKPGRIAAGRYPIKSVNHILKLLNSLEISAQNKGLDSNSLFIKSVVANKASRPWHYGRLRRRKMKRTHIEIIAEEKETEKRVKKGTQQKKEKPIEKKEIPKKEETKKSEEKKEQPKEQKREEIKK